MIGQNLTYQVGVLRYPSTTPPASNVSTVAAAVTVPIVALAIIAVLVIVGVLVLIHRRKQRKVYVVLRDLMHTYFRWAVGEPFIACDLFCLFMCL